MTPAPSQRYEKAAALNESRQGTFASPHVNLSAYYNRTGDAPRALDHARKAIALDPKSDRAWFQRAKADEREGRFAEAVGALNHAITLNTRASSYYYVLASLYRRLGDLEESKKALEMFTRLERESSELDKKRRGALPPRPATAAPCLQERGVTDARRMTSRRTFLQILGSAATALAPGALSRGADRDTARHRRTARRRSRHRSSSPTSPPRPA